MARKHTRFGGRTLSRSHALQLLFQAEATGRTVADVLEDGYVVTDGPIDDFAESLARGTDATLEDIDAVLEHESRNWSVSRMPATDRNLLRLALYEILEAGEVDVAISIDECVELARAFGTPDSPRFVNGVLGRLVERVAAGDDVVGEARAAREAARAEAAAEAARKQAEMSAEESEEGALSEGAEDSDAESSLSEGTSEDGMSLTDEPADSEIEDVPATSDEDPFAWPRGDA